VKCTCMGLATALVVAVLGTETALAQPASPAVAPKVEIGSDTKYVAVVLAGDVQEEVEILRRLLEKSLNSVYGTGLLTPSDNTYQYRVPGLQQPQPSPNLEGVYLKDYGVVYTITLPPPPNNMLSGPSAGVVTRTPLSPWERTRKELRGEKIEDDGKGAVGSPSLSDVILKVLADNGKHFTRLAEGERITVAVTFRDDAANGIYHPQPPGSSPFPSGSGTGGAFPPAAFGGPPVLSPSSGFLLTGPMSPGGPSAPAAPEGDAAWLTDVRNAIRLGELHLQRGKSEDAITAYKEALARLEKEVFSRRSAQGKTPGGGAAAGDVPLLLMEVELCNKIAQVYIQAGNSEYGRILIQRGSKLAKEAETLTGNAATANPRPSTPALPSKLIVTASKKLLDEIGSGKMTFEAFRKAATVEYVTPSAADKK
jgi:hypothetical protein